VLHLTAVTLEFSSFFSFLFMLHLFFVLVLAFSIRTFALLFLPNPRRFPPLPSSDFFLFFLFATRAFPSKAGRFCSWFALIFAPWF